MHSLLPKITGTLATAVGTKASRETISEHVRAVEGCERELKEINNELEKGKIDREKWLRKLS